MCFPLWAELPQDIVESISKKFTIYTDYLLFRSVCHKWRLYSPQTPLHLPPQLPCHMLSHNSFFDLSTNTIHSLNLAPWFSTRTLICGSSHGCLVIVDEFSNLRLLNPITRATMSLPKLPVVVRMDWNDTVESLCLIKVVLSSGPFISDDFTAFAMLRFNQFAFFTKGSDSWVVLDWNIQFISTDVVYKNGSFYVVGINGKIAVFDLVGSQISHVEMTGMSFVNEYPHLVFLKENLLMVTKNMSDTTDIKIYTMNWNVGKWERIQSLGGHSLFIGRKSSICCCAADFVGCRPNCIYFSDYLFGKEFGIYSLSDESVEPLSGCPKSSYGRTVWFEPSLNWKNSNVVSMIYFICIKS